LKIKSETKHYLEETLLKLKKSPVWMGICYVNCENFR